MGPNLFLPLKSCNYSHIKSHSARAIPQEGEIPSSGVLQGRGAPAGRVTEQKPPDVPGAAQQVQLAGVGWEHSTGACASLSPAFLPFRNDSLHVWGWLCADLQGQAINLSSGIAEGALAQP